MIRKRETEQSELTFDHSLNWVVVWCSVFLCSNNRGEGKVWYGVPASATDQIEQAFRDSMPELFASSPDLLFHITTMLSPRILKDAGVPCYKVVQRAGEYVITWPKAYHGGFSLGFNCAEAVNLCAQHNKNAILSSWKQKPIHFAATGSGHKQKEDSSKR